MGLAVQPANQTSSGIHRSEDLIRIFNGLFATPYNTRLQGGAPEPEYLPAGVAASTALVLFRHDYFASALHEVAHWCIAGARRRSLADYGYWYAPDGRSVEQQALFEQVEVKPQAMEWVFACAAGYRFRLSADNLAQNAGPSETFAAAVAAQAQIYATSGLPTRAAAFAAALTQYYGGSYAAEQFQPDRL